MLGRPSGPFTKANMSQNQSRYAGIREKSATREANYLMPGIYILLLEACEEGKTRNRVGFNVFKFKVLADLGGNESNSRRTGAPHRRHRPGESVGWMLTDDKDAFLPNLKQAVGIASEGDPDDVTEEDVEFAFGTEQPLAGKVLEVSAVHVLKKPAREKPEDKITDADFYTRVIFRRVLGPQEVREQVSADVLQRHAPQLLAQS